MIVEVWIEGEETPRRYRVRHDDKTVTLQAIDPDASGASSLVEPLSIDWRMPEPRVYSLLVDGNSYDVHIDEDERDEERLTVHLLSHVIRAQASDARKRRVSGTAAEPDGVAQIVAPIPGRVVSVLAVEGTEVQRGDGIIVLEAMKMENELKAPRDGVVIRVAVQQGQGVEGGALLATIE